MQKYLAALFMALSFFGASPAFALVCDDPSGFVKLKGPITLGDALILWPDCQSAADGGAAGLVVGSTPISSGTTLGFLYNVGGVLANSAFVKQITNGSNNPSLQIGNGSSTGDDSAAIATRTLAPASGLLNSHAFRDETVATSNASGSQFSGYASFDCAAQINGANITVMNHVHCFQARPLYSNTGSVTEVAGFTALATINSNTSIANVYGYFMNDGSKSNGGTITNQYAYYSNVMSAGANNYFVYQGGAGNLSYMPGGLIVGGDGTRNTKVSVEQVTVPFNGGNQFGISISDTSAAVSSGVLEFYRGTSNVGAVLISSTGTTYNTTSDERLKNFTGRYSPKAAEKIIRDDPVRTFNWKKDGASAIGWGAQTSYAISHDLATPGREPDDIWGMDFAKRTPYLWAAVSRLLDRVDTLERELKNAKHHARR